MLYRVNAVGVKFRVVVLLAAGIGTFSPPTVTNPRGKPVEAEPAGDTTCELDFTVSHATDVAIALDASMETILDVTAETTRGIASRDSCTCIEFNVADALAVVPTSPVGEQLELGAEGVKDPQAFPDMAPDPDALVAETLLAETRPAVLYGPAVVALAVPGSVWFRSTSSPPQGGATPDGRTVIPPMASTRPATPRPYPPLAQLPDMNCALARTGSLHAASVSPNKPRE